MKRFKMIVMMVLLLSSVISIQVFSQDQWTRDLTGNAGGSWNNIDPVQFPTSIETEKTDAGYLFKMSITNNSGVDWTVDHEFFGQMFLYDEFDGQQTVHYLKGRNWDEKKPQTIAVGQTITEQYELTIEKLRALDGRADGKYNLYAVPAAIINNQYFQLYMVYSSFEVATGDDSPPPVVKPDMPTNVQEIEEIWDINQFETMVEIEKTTDGYLFKMRATNNSGTDLVVDQFPIFTDIKLWDEAQQQWYQLRDPQRGQEASPELIANGQTIEERFTLSTQNLRSLDGRADGNYTFLATPKLIIQGEQMQLKNAAQSFDVAIGQDGAGGSDGGGNTGVVVDPGRGVGERPPLDDKIDVSLPAPPQETGINIFDFPTTVNAVKTNRGYRFEMEVTNNSGRDIMTDNLPVFARIIVYDFQTGEWLYLREKSWENNPSLFTSGKTLKETYDVNGLKAGKYYFFAVPSIVINNNYNQLVMVSAEFELN